MSLTAHLQRLKTDFRRQNERLREHLPPGLSDLLSTDLLFGCLLGAGAGLWAISARAVEGTESTDLIALAGAAAGLLAATLAVMALLISFLSDKTADLIADAGGVRSFFRPFRIIALISAAAILASVAGAIDASKVSDGSRATTSPGPTWLAAVLFGVAIWFFVWAVIGVAQLVRIFIEYGQIHQENRVSDDDPDETI